MHVFPAVAAILCLSACSRPVEPAAFRELHVAAASNLNRVLPELTAAFTKATGISVIPSYGATAQLTQQIENGAPYDVFLAADVEHVDQLIAGHFASSGTRSIYARGHLVVYSPNHRGLKSLEQLTAPEIRTIVIAKPELAPYGAAAVETLQSAGLWNQLAARVVYAPGVSIAKQFADTGNGDAAFTALALVKQDNDRYFAVDEKLHKPIDQALCIVARSPRQASARAFTGFLAGGEARSILKQFGY